MRALIFLCWLICFGLPLELAAQRQPKVSEEEVVITTRILFVLDASGSMAARWQNQSRWEVATRLLSNIMDSLERRENVEVALRVYGHQTSRAGGDCKDTKLEVPFGENSGSQIKRRLKSIKPLGNTPIAYSLSHASKDFPQDPFARNILILITDGLENCGGDPCQVSYQLQKQHIFLKPFVIGLGLDVSVKDAFNCVGTYYDAEQEQAFKQALDMVVSQALNSTTVQVDLLDQFLLPTETNVVMTFYDHELGIDRYNFLHTLNSRKKSDTLLLDPANMYDLVIHTNPEIRKDKIVLLPGKHNVIKLNSPQGALELAVGGVSGYRNLRATVRDSKTGKLITMQEFNTTRRYLTGTYDIEVLTTPILNFNGVEIKQGKTEKIQIPQPGMVNLVSNTEGFGAIFSTSGPKLEKVHDMNPGLTSETVVLQPGNYKAVFRSKNSSRAIFSIEKEFTVSSGGIVTVRF
ncbi:MAG: vWA domain-containing protein [Bacteroidia bacterium]